MKRPTLLVISQVYVPDTPSVGQHMHEAAAALASRGVRVRVMTSARGYEDPSQVFPAYEERDGVEITRLPLSSFGKKSIRHRLVGQLLFLFQVAIRGVFQPGLSGIVVSTSPPMAAAAALFIQLFRRVPLKFWAMDLNPDQMVEMGRISPNALSVRMFNVLNRMLLRNADEVIALDRFMADRLNAKVDVTEKTTILAPWPHEQHGESVPHDENPFRKAHNLEGKFVVMYSGNHAITSPLTTLLEAAVQMQDRENLLFMFIGGGKGKQDVDDTIAKHAPRNIVSLPYQPLEQLRFSLSAADVHVVSMGEKVVGIIHPCKIYGAMSLGRPILFLGPSECHITDIMRKEHIGWHVQHGDVDGMIRTLDTMLAASPSDLHEMGQNAAEIIDRDFNHAKMLEEFCDIVLGPQRSPSTVAASASSKCVASP